MFLPSHCTALYQYLKFSRLCKHVTIGGVFFPFQDFGIKLVTILVILMFTFLNMTGLRGGAWVSKAILILVGAGLLVIVVFGLTSNVAKPANFMNVKDLANGTVTLSSFYTAMLAAFWAYQGWVSVGFIGGEIKDPTRNIPKGIAAGVGMIIVIYAVVNLTYLSLLSIPELISINEAGNQIAGVEAVRRFLGNSRGCFHLPADTLIYPWLPPCQYSHGFTAILRHGARRTFL